MRMTLECVKETARQDESTGLRCGVMYRCIPVVCKYRSAQFFRAKLMDGFRSSVYFSEA